MNRRSRSRCLPRVPPRVRRRGPSAGPAFGRHQVAELLNFWIAGLLCLAGLGMVRPDPAPARDPDLALRMHFSAYVADNCISVSDSA
jgi:hypothetical protein